MRSALHQALKMCSTIYLRRRFEWTLNHQALEGPCKLAEVTRMWAPRGDEDGFAVIRHILVTSANLQFAIRNLQFAIAPTA